MHDKILILDFGSQVTQLIARRVREAKVYSEIHPYDCDPDFIRRFIQEEGGKGIILSGGPNSVTEGETPRAPQISSTLRGGARSGAWRPLLNRESGRAVRARVGPSHSQATPLESRVLVLGIAGYLCYT
jgi:hypothetical protein